MSQMLLSYTPLTEFYDEFWYFQVFSRQVSLKNITQIHSATNFTTCYFNFIIFKKALKSNMIDIGKKYVNNRH